MESKHLQVNWDNFHKIMRSGITSLLENEDFVDVTLAVEGHHLKAHKMVLSVCSPYFCELFKTSPCKHPIVFMKDVSYTAMKSLLQFMYQGEVQVNEENFITFIKTAESLQIRGLSHYGNGSTEGVAQLQKPMERSESSTITLKSLLSENTPKCDEIVKTETTTSSFEVSTPCKTEPYDQVDPVLVVGDDSSVENVFDDPLDDTNADDNEDDWMMEEAEAGTSAESPEGLISDSEDVPTPVTPTIPEKSKEKYENTFTCFEQWCGERDIKAINENVLIEYFKEKSLTYKSSSLMVFYSILRTMLLIKKHIDISQYRNLVAFLKRKSKGIKSKILKVFKKEDFERFLREANDYTFLMMKVVMIISIAGACRRYELTHLLVENVIDEGDVIRIKIPDFRNTISREILITGGTVKNVNFIEIIRKYMNLRPANMCNQRFFILYKHGKCFRQPVGKNTFGAMPKTIAQFLGLPNPELYTGHCFWRTSSYTTKNALLERE